MTIPDRLSAALADRYRIERELGAGGMATVYLAHDLKHDRKVAVKVLRPELAAVLGAERFVVEIKTTAALSHPHILPLFDSGEADGFLYYVMPYIEGETIRERLNRETQLGVDEAVKITTEIADALDYAHRHGVIHRDIKPENLLLHDKRPMVMDFGIALALSAAAGGRMTETGLSLGTPHYMSPEQATAEKDISARSDVYSLASVLYEMLTGQPPHDGGSAQQVIMRIITDTPRPVTELRKSVPNHVAAAVAKALEKLPADRFSSAREFADALTNAAFTTNVAGAGAEGVRVFGRQRSWRTIIATGVLGGALGGAVLASVAWTFAQRQAPPINAPVMRAELSILTRTDSGVFTRGLDISPDGSMLVYAARGPGTDFDATQLYLRRLDDRTARPIPGTEGASAPAFSPDGASIAFVHAGRAIRRIPVGGGVVENIVQGRAQELFDGPRWARDGFIYYVSFDGAPRLSRVQAQGGTPSVLLSTGQADFPEPLPGGRHVLYTECCASDADVRVLDISTGEAKSLGLKARFVRYAPSGHLLLIGDDAIKAVPFDAKTLAVGGDPQSVLDSVTANGRAANFVVSANGTAAYVVRAGGGGGNRSLALVDLAGNERRIPLAEARFADLSFSPDGRRIAYVSAADPGGADYRLSVHDLVVGTTSEITRLRGYSLGLVWLPSGRELLFPSGSDDTVQFIARARVDGSGKIDTLSRSTTRPEIRSPLSVTPDGKQLLLQLSGPEKDDLEVASLDSLLGVPRGYLVANWDEIAGQISPDGRWVAYQSNEEAPPSDRFRAKVYVRSFPEPGERYTISDSVGRNPRWAPDGKTIYYWRGTTMVAASVASSPTFRVTGRRDLFARAQRTFAYDISPDGKQFVMTAPAATAAGTAAGFEPFRLVVVGNWLEELRRKLGEQR